MSFHVSFENFEKANDGNNGNIQGLHCRPHRPTFGDVSDEGHPEQADDGVRDGPHPVHHHKLVGGTKYLIPNC